MTAPLNADKLGKLLALASSDNDNEALTALRMAKNMLTTAGMDFKDVADRMATPKARTDFTAYPSWATQSPPPKPKGYTKGGFTWESKAAYDAYMAQEQARFEQARAKYADERAAVVAKYGSVDKASARDERETALHNAVAEWLVPEEGCKPKGRWSATLDGWTNMQSLDNAPARVVEAIKAAMPLPTTIPAAIAELATWTARNREIELAIEDYSGNGGLDLPAQLRCDILRRMIECDLPATNIGDVITRMEYAEESCCSFTTSDMAKVALGDLRRLLPALSRSPRPKKSRSPAQDQIDLFGV